MAKKVSKKKMPKLVSAELVCMGSCPLNKKDCFSYENGYCMNLFANMKQIAKLKHCKLYKSK